MATSNASTKSLMVDDRHFQALVSELSERERVRALRGAFRKAALVLRRAVVSNLRASIRSDKDLERGVRAVVFKNRLGFRVTVGTAKGKGYHRNRFGLLKPVLVFAEDGTDERATHKGAARGRMRRYGFVVKGGREVAPSLRQELTAAIVEKVRKTALRHGCK